MRLQSGVSANPQPEGSDSAGRDTLVEKENHRMSYMEKIIGEKPLHINVDELPSPVFNGDVPTVTLGKKAVERGNIYCQYSLIGRLDFGKMSILRTRTLASQAWAPEGEWKMVLLVNVLHAKARIKRRFHSNLVADLEIGNQLICFNGLSLEIIPDKHKSSNALLW